MSKLNTGKKILTKILKDSKKQKKKLLKITKNL